MIAEGLNDHGALESLFSINPNSREIFDRIVTALQQLMDLPSSVGVPLHPERQMQRVLERFGLPGTWFNPDTGENSEHRAPGEETSGTPKFSEYSGQPIDNLGTGICIVEHETYGKAIVSLQEAEFLEPHGWEVIAQAKGAVK